MNILHHKSWHVRNKDNIERVRRDEAKAADEEKEKQRRAALADQEARTELLRVRSRQKQSANEITESDGHAAIGTGGTSKSADVDRITRPASRNDAVDFASTSHSDVTSTSHGHMNFFKDLEDGEMKFGKNTEREKEKKAEKEKWEKSIGLLTYLGQSSVESKETPPWYLSGKKRKIEESTLKISENDKRRQSTLDPLNDMKKYVEKKEHKKHKAKDKKHKDRPHQQYVQVVASSSKSLDQLRAERLARETKERQRTETMLARARGEVVPEDSNPTEAIVRQPKYNSQYNPDFVRPSKHR